MSQLDVQQQLQTAVAHHQQGDFATAAGMYANVLQADPANPDAWHLSGLIAFQQQRFDQAETCIRQALSIRPDHGEFQSNLASVLLATEREVEAENICRQILQQCPNHNGAWQRMGSALSAQDRKAEAIEAFEKAVSLRPDDVQSLCNLGVVLIERRQFPHACEVLQKALSYDRDCFQALLNLAVAERESGLLDSALRRIDRALQIRPDSSECRLTRGNIQMDQGNVVDALYDFNLAVRNNPRSASALNAVGRALQVIRRWKEAREAFQLACLLDRPNQRFESNRLYCASLDPDLSAEQLSELHREWGSKVEQSTTLLPPSRVNSSGVIRIAYLSPDFYSHATMRFFTSFFEHHDRSRYEFFCYSNSTIHDSVTQSVQSHCSVWRQTEQLSDEELALQIRSDRIDIAIDLAGHTSGNRLQALAYRPAPIQATFLGYPTTTGLSRIDYLLTDAIREPEASSSLFTETLIHLKHGGCCFGSKNDSVLPSERPASKNGYITFGSTHRLEKISPQCMKLWARILKAVPDSRLLIFRDVLKSSDVRTTLITNLCEAGVPVDRIETGWELPRQHLELYHDIDILLDVFPWGSGTTAYESMWMGVPIPTLAGDRGGCRATASMMVHCGYPELAADSPDEYVQLVAALARSPKQLEEIRNHCRERMQQTVCNGPRFAEDLEAAFSEMILRSNDFDRQETPAL